MIAAIALSSLVGTWSCVDDVLPGYKVLYTFRANHTGALVVIKGRSISAKRHFTFKLTNEGLVEQFTDPGSVLELHDIWLTRRHLVDKAGAYRKDGQWLAASMQPVLDCTR